MPLDLVFIYLFIDIFKNFNSSNYNYDSCDAENAINHCLKCYSGAHRILQTNATGNYCLC